MQPTSVLIVEDNAILGEALADLLEEAGYNVTLARGGAEALELLAQRSFAVVLSDIYMPGVNGVDVLQAAHQSRSRPEVILLTGYSSLDTSLTAMHEGTFDYLLKPCHPETLLQRVADAVTAHEACLQQLYAVQHNMSGVGDSR